MCLSPERYFLSVWYSSVVDRALLVALTEVLFVVIRSFAESSKALAIFAAVSPVTTPRYMSVCVCVLSLQHKTDC